MHTPQCSNLVSTHTPTAQIADNVGDNVGDVAGMGADLFESYAGAVIATATLAPALAQENYDQSLGSIADMNTEYNLLLAAGVALPFAIDGFGIIASLVGTALVRNADLDDSTTLDVLLQVITNGVWLASVVTLGFTALCCAVLFKTAVAWKLFGCVAIGLVAGIIIAKWTEYCTSYTDPPTRDISSASEYGPAPVIIKGLGVGMFSVAVPTICIGVTVLACDKLSGQYGVAISAVGLLSTLGITLATDAYGPVADNAGGIAEMANCEAYVRVRTDALDALGNTTAATGKGLAIASATLTAVGLIAAFVEQSGLAKAKDASRAQASRVVDLTDSLVLTGVLIGSCLPYIFAALTMLSVDRGARAIITEVRLQFATAPMLMRGSLTQVVDGHLYPDSTRCVQIATTAAIQEMVLPGVLAVFVPVAIGFILGPKGMAGLMAGVLGGCFMLALTMATSGGAWDNAKKWVSACALEGEPTGKKDKGPVTFTNYGIKNARDFPKLYREHGINAFIKDPKMAVHYDSPEGLARLQVRARWVVDHVDASASAVACRAPRCAVFASHATHTPPARRAADHARRALPHTPRRRRHRRHDWRPLQGHVRTRESPPPPPRGGGGGGGGPGGKVAQGGIAGAWSRPDPPFPPESE